MPKLLYQINLNQTFIAVGVGHLAGENGLIELFRKKGYKLKAVNILKE